MKRVLFVCIHNSARSQMAETFMNHYGEGEFIAESAGFETKPINPLSIAVMLEDGFDISDNRVDNVFDFYKQGHRYNYIITVCDEGAAKKCPVFPGVLHTIHWNFPDPSALKGTELENLEKTRYIKDEIKTRVIELIALIKANKLEEDIPMKWKLDIQSKRQTS